MIFSKIATAFLQLFGEQQQESWVIEARSFPFNFQSHGKDRRLDPIEFHQVGKDLYGTPGSDYQSSHTEFGTTVILSQRDGSRLAVGAPLHDWSIPFEDTSKFISKEAGGIFLYHYDPVLSVQWELLWFLTGDQGEKIGSRFSLSADGARIAVRRYNTNPSSVQVYDVHSDGTSSLVGSQIESFANGDTVTLSPDGKRLAVSSESFNKSIGRVEIYELDVASSWMKIGTIDCNVYGHATSTNIQQQRCGWMTSFSSSGNRLAISSPNYSSNGITKRGKVQVYDYDYLQKTWKQVGKEVMGLYADDRFGFSMSLSSDGTSLVVGIPGSDGGSYKRGSIQVFHLINGYWIQKGNAIQGQLDNDRFGRSVSTSEDGNRVAASSYTHDQQRGQLRVLQYYGENDDWVQIGTDIDGGSPRDRFGFGLYSVTMTGDGDRFASGSIFRHNRDGLSTGRVRVFGDSELEPGFCGFPTDMLEDDDPFERLEMLCDSTAKTSGQCHGNFFFSAYQCEWIDGQCTSDADGTGEDSECPLITTKTACEMKSWSGPRRCVWYRFSDRVPPPAPEWDTNSAFCGYPIDFIEGTDDPFAKPRQPCHTTAPTEEVCTKSTFLSLYECFWKDGRCLSQAASTNEDTNCPAKDTQVLCDGSKWVGSRACVWYDEEVPLPKASTAPSPSEVPSSRSSLSPSSSNNHMTKPSPISSPSESPPNKKEPTVMFPSPVIQPIMIELTPNPVPISNPLQHDPSSNESSASPSIKSQSLSPSGVTQSPSSLTTRVSTRSPQSASNESNNVISPIVGPDISNGPIPSQETTITFLPSAYPTFWFDQKPSPRTMISPAPTIDGGGMITACQCDTSLRKCVNEPVREQQSLYICLSLTPKDDNNAAAQFVDIRDLTIVQDGKLSDTVIRQFTSTLLTFVNVEEKYASIRTEVKPEFFRNDTPDDVSVEGLVIIAPGGNHRDLQQNGGGGGSLGSEDERYLETTTIVGDFQIQVGLVPSTENKQSVTITVEQPDEEFWKEDNQESTWSWKGLAAITGFTAAGLSIFLLIRYFLCIRSRRVPSGIPNGGGVVGQQGTPVHSPAVMSMGFASPGAGQTFVSPTMMVPTTSAVTSPPPQMYHSSPAMPTPVQHQAHHPNGPNLVSPTPSHLFSLNGQN